MHLQPLNKEILVLLQQQKLPKDHISLKILIPQDRPHVLFRLYRQHEPCQIPCPQASFPARHQFQLGRSPKHCWFDHEQNRLPKYSVMILNTSFSPMGSATKFLCFCEVVDILRMVLWCLECSAKGRHHTDICAKRSHTGERTVHKRAIEIFNEIFKSSIGGWLAPRSLQLGTWSAGYSYAEVLWMQQEPTSRLECRSESVLQGTFKKIHLSQIPGNSLLPQEVDRRPSVT